MKWRTIRSNDQEISKVLKYLTFIMVFIQMTDYNRHIINNVNYKCSINDQIILFIINYIHNNIVDFTDSVLNTQLYKPFYPKNVSNISSRLRCSKIYENVSQFLIFFVKNTGSCLEMDNGNVTFLPTNLCDIWKIAEEAILNSTRFSLDRFIHVDQHRGPLLFHGTIAT